MAFCSGCGSENRPGVRFCGKCGQPVGQAAVAQVPKAKHGGPQPPQAPAAVPPASCGGSVKGGRKYTVEEFIQTTGQKDRGEGLFELEGDRILEINLDGQVWTKMGSMIAYLGQIKFTREGILEHGLGKLLKRAATGEGFRLTKAEGKGCLYLADEGKKISIINLQGNAIYVNGNDLLAFQEGIAWDIKFMRKVAAVLAGGLFNVKLAGTGMIAITTYYDPLTLRVTPQSPITTDPNATVAWSDTLTPELKTDISFKTFFGRGSGESFQMMFHGNGFVVIQPLEEATFQSRSKSS